MTGWLLHETEAYIRRNDRRLVVVLDNYQLLVKSLWAHLALKAKRMAVEQLLIHFLQ